MRLGNMHLEYFGSYKELDLDLSSIGLGLISGPTGSGKSTVLDGPAWIIFGETSKDSGADDMRSWFADQPTLGYIEILDAGITVYRIRGNASQNDLFWYEHGDDITKHHRGKDLKDTQRLIIERLGVSSELFILGSYLHQFSQAEAFFLAKAKDRREIFEKTADLSLPKSLGEKASEARKKAKKDLQDCQQQLANKQGQLEASIKARVTTTKAYEQWNFSHKEKCTELQRKAENFEQERRNEVEKLVYQLEELASLVLDPKHFEDRKAQIKLQIKSIEQAKLEHKKQSKILRDLENKLNPAIAELKRLYELHNECPTCFSPVSNNPHLAKRVAELEAVSLDLDTQVDNQSKLVDTIEKSLSVEPQMHKAYDACRDDEAKNQKYIRDFEERKAKTTALRSAKNTYADQLTELSKENNPFDKQLSTSINLIDSLQQEIESKTKEISELEHLAASLTWLYDKSFELRAYMLEQAKTEINQKTNEYLEKHFDADLRISLMFEGQDKLEVGITKNGYNAPYKQLSGGQRDMLRLCFWLAVSKRVEAVSNTKFGTIMIDEALKGLDPSIKTKVFGLLQTLEVDYDTVLLVDHHEEFKALFENQLSVRLNGDMSELTNA